MYPSAVFQLIIAIGIGTVVSKLLSLTGMTFPIYIVIAYYVEQYQKDLESDDMLQPFTYVLYDMDKDGTPELIVRTGYSLRRIPASGHR